MVQLITVKSKGAGGYQVVTKIESVDVKGAGAETNQLKGATFTQTVSPTGKTSNMSTTASGQAKMMVSMMQALDAGFLGIVYPTNPVGVGSSWSATLDLTKMMGAIPGGSMMKIVSGGKIPMKYKLLGIKGSGNNRVAGLSISGAGSMTMQVTPPQGQGQPQKMTMKFNTSTSAKVDVATGMPSTMDGNATIVMQIMGNTMTQHLKVKMVRK
jgi:hypothetical protein